MSHRRQGVAGAREGLTAPQETLHIPAGFALFWIAARPNRHLPTADWKGDVSQHRLCFPLVDRLRITQATALGVEKTI